MSKTSVVLAGTHCEACGSIVPPRQVGKVHNIGDDPSRWCGGRPAPAIEAGKLYRMLPELADGTRWRGVVMVAVRPSLGDVWRFVSRRGGAWLPPPHVEDAVSVRASTRRALAVLYEDLGKVGARHHRRHRGARPLDLHAANDGRSPPRGRPRPPGD